MKHVGTTVGLLLLASVFAPRASAQYRDRGDHVEVGVFGDYFRWHQGGDINLAGVGARVSLNLAPVVQLEAQGAYDFSQAFTEGFRNLATGSLALNTSNLRLLHGEFGPKLQTNRGPLRLFITAKGGAMAFRFDPRPVTFGTFTSSVEDLRADTAMATFYPGGGVEAYLGPVGLRLDVGDTMYFANGVHHNLTVQFGPSIRF
jgi:hypothetical protein